MDLFSLDFWSALLAIVMIDLVLAGDNAIVIGLSARNLPKELQKKTIFWGMLGAIVIRSLLTFAVVWLLKIPGLLLAGGILLIWIAFKLLVDEKKHDVSPAASVVAAVKTIIIADTVMGLDNVLAVAGAAHGSFLLVVAGLMISIPIVIWGSTLIIKWVERFPVIIFAGAAVLAWTASKMVVGEPFMKPFFAQYPAVKWALTIVVIAGVLIAGKIKKMKQTAADAKIESMQG